MGKCLVCERPTGWFTRSSHAECEAMQSPYHIARGEFTSCNSQAQLLLERDETCLAVVKGCEIADVAAISVGVASDAHKASASAGAGGSSAESESDGWNDVEEGPKVQPKAGFLHVTTRRICFVGTFKEKTIPLSAVVEVHFANNI